MILCMLCSRRGKTNEWWQKSTGVACGVRAWGDFLEPCLECGGGHGVCPVTGSSDCALNMRALCPVWKLLPEKWGRWGCRVSMVSCNVNWSLHGMWRVFAMPGPGLSAHSWAPASRAGECAHLCRSACHQPQHSSGGWSGAASPRFTFTVAEITQTTWPSFYLWSLERAPDVKCPFPVCDLI